MFSDIHPAKVEFKLNNVLLGDSMPIHKDADEIVSITSQMNKYRIPGFVEQFEKKEKQIFRQEPFSINNMSDQLLEQELNNIISSEVRFERNEKYL